MREKYELLGWREGAYGKFGNSELEADLETELEF